MRVCVCVCVCVCVRAYGGGGSGLSPIKELKIWMEFTLIAEQL